MKINMQRKLKIKKRNLELTEVKKENQTKNLLKLRNEHLGGERVIEKDGWGADRAQ